MIHVWHHKRMIRMISTIHPGEMVESPNVDFRSGATIIKPKSVVEYNKYMAGIDKADQMRSYCNISRKSVKWSKKMALYLINCALINAYILYKKSKDQISNLPFKVFAETISEEWLDLESVPDIPRNINENRSHLPSIIPNKKRRSSNFAAQGAIKK